MIKFSFSSLVLNFLFFLCVEKDVKAQVIASTDTSLPEEHSLYQNLSAPQGIAFDSEGNIYFAEHFRVCKIDRYTKILTTIVSSRETDYANDKNPTNQCLKNCTGSIIIGSNNDLYIADADRIWKIDGITHKISSLEIHASSEDYQEYATNRPEYHMNTFSVDEPQFLHLKNEKELFFFSENTIYQFNLETKRLTPITGQPFTVVNDLLKYESINASDINSGKKTLPNYSSFEYIPNCFSIDNTGENLFIAYGNNIKKVNMKNGDWKIIAGGGELRPAEANGKKALDIKFDNISWMAFDKENDLYFIVGGGSPSGQPFKFDEGNGTIKLLDGSRKEEMWVTERNAAYRLVNPSSFVFDPNGNCYVTDIHLVKKFSDGAVETIAGTGVSGIGSIKTIAKLRKHISDSIAVAKRTQDSALAKQAYSLPVLKHPANHALYQRLNGPLGLAFDEAGNLYFSDVKNYRLNCIDSSGIMKTIAGMAVKGFSGDDSLALNAKLEEPGNIAFGKNGDLYFIDGSRLRKISRATGIIKSLEVFKNRHLISEVDNLGRSSILNPFFVSATNLFLSNDTVLYFLRNTIICKFNLQSEKLERVTGPSKFFGEETLPLMTEEKIDEIIRLYQDSKQYFAFFGSYDQQKIFAAYADDKHQDQNFLIKELILKTGEERILAGGGNTDILTNDYSYMIGKKATDFNISQIVKIVCDKFGNVYFITNYHNRLYKINKQGTFEYVNDSLSSQVARSVDFTINSKGDFYYSNDKNFIIKYNIKNSSFETIAGNGEILMK